MINKLILSHIYWSGNKTCRLYSAHQQKYWMKIVRGKSHPEAKLKETESEIFLPENVVSFRSSLLNSHTVLLPPIHVRWCQWWNFLRKLSAQLQLPSSQLECSGLVEDPRLGNSWASPMHRMPWSLRECPGNLQQSAVKLPSNLSTLDYWSCLPPTQLSGRSAGRRGGDGAKLWNSSPKPFRDCTPSRERSRVSLCQFFTFLAAEMESYHFYERRERAALKIVVAAS